MSGQLLRRVGESANVAGRRVLCVDETGTTWAVPFEWTALSVPSAEVEVNAGRAYVLLDDLLALAELIRRARR